VAAALVQWGRANGYAVSLPAAAYAIANARHLNLLDRSNRWTSLGLAFGCMEHLANAGQALERRELTVFQQRLYAKQYVETAGALLIKFGQWLLNVGETTEDAIRDDALIEKLFINVLDEYLEMSVDIRDRTQIRRERDRMKAVRYSSITQRHKRRPLLTTMRRLGLLECELCDTHNARIRPDRSGRLRALIAAIPDARTLEEVVNEGTLVDDLHPLYAITPAAIASRAAPQLILEAYVYAADQGLHACPLEYIDGLIYAYGVHEGAARIAGTAERVLEIVRRSASSAVRFHVNRQGRRAFVVISDSGLASIMGMRVSSGSRD